MKKQADLILILNVGVGVVNKVIATQYVNGISETLAKVTNAEERGIEIVAIPCPQMMGIRVEVIPIKALLEGKYVLKEEIKLPEMEEVLAILKSMETGDPNPTLNDAEIAKPSRSTPAKM